MDPIRREAIARRIAELMNTERHRQQLTQTQLGTIAGIPQAAVSRYLTAATTMPLGSFIALHTALGLSADDLEAEASGDIG